MSSFPEDPLVAPCPLDVETSRTTIEQCYTGYGCGGDLRSIRIRTLRCERGQRPNRVWTWVQNVEMGGLLDVQESVSNLVCGRSCPSNPESVLELRRTWRFKMEGRGKGVRGDVGDKGRGKGTWDEVIEISSQTRSG